MKRARGRSNIINGDHVSAKKFYCSFVEDCVIKTFRFRIMLKSPDERFKIIKEIIHYGVVIIEMINFFVGSLLETLAAAFVTFTAEEVHPWVPRQK